MNERVEAGSGSGFFRSRWQGEVPLARLFWRDLLTVGTLINIAFSAVALMLLSQDAPLIAVLVVHFAPTPYNIFLVGSVWRAAEKTGGAAAWMMTLGAIIWLFAALLI